MLSQFIVIISFTLIFSLFEIIETPYFHELGHVLVANKYKRTDCRILLRRGYGISSKHIKVKTNCDHQELSNDALGQSCLENMYQGYTEKQIAIIARAGCINACVYVCIMSLIFFLVIQGFSFIKARILSAVEISEEVSRVVSRVGVRVGVRVAPTLKYQYRYKYRYY